VACGCECRIVAAPVLLRKLTVSQHVKTFLALYRTRYCGTSFTTPHFPYPEPDESSTRSSYLISI
jgi:hypothetical protein